MGFMHFVRPLSRLFAAAPPSPPGAAAQVAAPDPGATAIRNLGDGERLRQLAGLTEGGSPPASPDLERIARERTAQLIDAGAIDFSELCASTRNVRALLAVAGLSGNPAHLAHALALIDDPRTVAELVTEGSSSRLRQLAAQSIQDPAELKQLLKQVRGKDKSVYKVIKHKCDALRAEEQRIAQIESDITALCESLERHSHRTFDALYVPSFEHFKSRWQTLESQASPQMQASAGVALDRCREVIAAHARRLTQQAEEESQRAALRVAREAAAALAAAQARDREEASALAAAESAKLREAEEQARAERLAAEAHALRQIGGLVGKANDALREGNTGRAAGLRRAIEEKLQGAPPVPPHLVDQVLKLDAKLNELKEWKDYAVAPKRAALIEEMEGLIGSSEEPKALADRIKQLQEDWKTISKGIISDSEADWQRFQRASLEAYRPCRVYFEAQAALRQQNLEHRRATLERLRAFETAQSGENPDWRAIAEVLREARQEWRRHYPVDRAAGLAAQQDFDAALVRLQARLDAWHAGNVADKKALIQRAQQLRTKEDSREAVDAVKRLQLQWKEIGAGPRDQDHPLWDEFREQCDAVYQKRQQAHDEYTAALETNKVRALALCEDAERAAELTGPALIEGMGKIVQSRADFENLGEMPRSDERRLRDRFERALDLCQSRLSQQRAREKEQSFVNLLEAARRIQTYRWAVTHDAAPADRDALKQAAEDFIAGVQQWPKGGAQALKDAWTKTDAAGLDAASHETALRMLCVRGEIFAGRTTAPEDETLRREYQVQRLMQRMGQGGEANVDELDALALEWVKADLVAPETHELLLARFLRCR